MKQRSFLRRPFSLGVSFSFSTRRKRPPEASKFYINYVSRKVTDRPGFLSGMEKRRSRLAVSGAAS
jgi:hypothetical protein